MYGSIFSEEEAKQFKIQGQLFALYAARAPDIFFSGHHMSQVHEQSPHDMMNRQHSFMQQPAFYPADQQRLAYGHPQLAQQTPFPHQPHQYGLNDPSFEVFGQRPQGHTSTIKALKRKLQENFISSCKPNKLPRLSHNDVNGEGEFSKRGEQQYVMNVNVYRNSPSINQVFFGDSDIKTMHGGPGVPLIYQAARVDIDPTQALRNKRAMLVNAIAPVARPEVVQKLAPTCTLEQVVPEVTIPDCYLTPEPSPVNSPKPSYLEVAPKQETHEIKQLTTYVMGRLNEMKQGAREDILPQKPVVETKKKNLPIIDASFVDSFFDDLSPRSLKERMLNIKLEPMSPEAVGSNNDLCAVQQHRPKNQTSMDRKLCSEAESQQVNMPLQADMDKPIKQEITLEDCADLEELFGLVGTDQAYQTFKSTPSSTPDSVLQSVSPAVSPKLHIGSSIGESSPVPSYASSHGSPFSIDQQKFTEMSPCSSSPGYDDRDDILDPDNWLLEPISLSLDMALPELEPLVSDFKDKEDDLFHLKQLLQQQTWGPCGE